MLDLHRLQLLHHFAARGSIAATADELGFSASAVSQQLAALEREAGVALIERTARSATLTDLGGRLARHAATVLEAVEAAEADLAAHLDAPLGRVVIATAPTAAVALAPALAAVRVEHPALELVVRQEGPEAALDQLRSRDVDLAVVDDWSTGPAAERPGLVSRRLLRDPLVLAVPVGHPLAELDRRLELAATAEEPWICAPRGEPSREAFDRILRDHGVVVRTRWEFEGLATIATLVGRGVGIAVLPRLAIAEHLRDRLVERRLPEPRARHLDAVVRPGSRGRPALEVTLDAMWAEVADEGRDGSRIDGVGASAAADGAPARPVASHHERPTRATTDPGGTGVG
jgi:DNA-binding transcriptional LysR family regulator